MLLDRWGFLVPACKSPSRLAIVMPRRALFVVGEIGSTCRYLPGSLRNREPPARG